MLPGENVIWIRLDVNMLVKFIILENAIETWLTYIMAAWELTWWTMANNQNDPSRTDDKVDIFISGWSEVATTLKYIHVSHEQTSIDKIEVTR